jgi:hypothetical protein
VVGRCRLCLLWVSTFMNPCQWRLCNGSVVYLPSSQWPKSQSNRLGFVVDKVVCERFSSKYFDVACQYLSASAAYFCFSHLLQTLYKLGNRQHHWLKQFVPCKWYIVCSLNSIQFYLLQFLELLRMGAVTPETCRVWRCSK